MTTEASSANVTVCGMAIGAVLAVSVTGRVVVPCALETLMMFTVSLYGPRARFVAVALIETMSVVVAPGASVPFVGERLTQVVLLLAIQFRLPSPLLVSAYG